MSAAAALALDPFALADASDDAVTEARTAGWVRPRTLPRLPGASTPPDGPEVVQKPEGAEGASTAAHEGGVSLAVYPAPEAEPVEARAEIVCGPDLERAASYAAESKSRNTRRAYRSQLANFAAWCADRGFSPMPALPHVVASYLAWRADQGVRPSTLAIFLAALASAHKAAGEPNPRQSPIVESTWSGIRRTKGVAPTRKSPVLPTDLRAMVATTDPETLMGKRDVAICALGFAGALRRSEIVALDAEDLSFTDEGLVVRVRRSKTDQEGAGAVVGVAYGSDPKVCPVRAVRRWLDAAEITSGPVFVRLDHGGRHRTERLHDRGVARIVKRLAGRAGMEVARYSGHSLRAGLATAAWKAGKDLKSIMTQGRWLTSSVVLNTYVRELDLFGASNASAGLL